MEREQFGTTGLACTTKSHGKLFASFLAIVSAIFNKNYGICLPLGIKVDYMDL